MLCYTVESDTFVRKVYTECLLLATACFARRGLSYRLTVIDLYVYIYIYIYKFICLVCKLFSKYYSSKSCGPILMKFGMLVFGVLVYLKTASLCLYCLYKQSYDCLYFTIWFHVQSLMRWTRDYDVIIKTQHSGSSITLKILKFTHHNINIMNCINLIVISISH